MSKLILMSCMLGILIIPAIMARERSTKKGLKKTIIGMVSLYVFYIFALRYLWGRW